MPYHDSFWITIGAAAPVIALASVITMADAYKAGSRLAARLFMWVAGIALLNMALQAVALEAALASLEFTNNKFPPGIVGLVVPVGIVLVAATSILGVVPSQSAETTTPPDAPAPPKEGGT